MTALTSDKLKQLLGKRSKAELVTWVVDQTEVNDDLRSAVIEFVAPQADARTLVAELRRIISKAWERTRSSREPWKLARPIASDLEPVLPALDQLIERGHAVEAERVLRRFIEAADSGFDHVDDSYGYLYPVCQDAVTLWGKAWATIDDRNPADLAKMVFDEHANNGYALRDHMIRDFAAALGSEGLLALKALFHAQYEARQADKSIEDWKRREPLRHLAEVADALGDVDLYIDLQRQSGLIERYAIPIARRLLDTDRPSEALAYLDRGDSNHAYFQGEKEDFTTLRCRILLALGREDEVRDMLWQTFQQSLSSSALDRFLAMTPEAQHEDTMRQAVTVAENHRDRLYAAQFLMDRGEIARAARLVPAHPNAFDRGYYDTLLRLAEPLRDEHPAAAWILYRALLLDILEAKRSKAYHHAADYLAIMKNLAPRAGLTQRQHDLMADLRERHGRKYDFWSLVKD